MKKIISKIKLLFTLLNPKTRKALNESFNKKYETAKRYKLEDLAE